MAGGIASCERERIDVLILCTGNVCRSPLAERLLRRALEERGVPARVRSAGLLSEGRAVPTANLGVAAARGLDLSSHRSARMSVDMLREADLVLGMARAHVREAVVLDQSVWPRAFTLKELVRRAEHAGERPPDAPLRAWLATLHSGRAHRDVFGESDADDIADPIGGSDALYERVAAEIEGQVDRLVAIIWPT